MECKSSARCSTNGRIWAPHRDVSCDICLEITKELLSKHPPTFNQPLHALRSWLGSCSNPPLNQPPANYSCKIPRRYHWPRRLCFESALRFRPCRFDEARGRNILRTIRRKSETGREACKGAKKQDSWGSLPPHYSVCSSISLCEMVKARALLFLSLSRLLWPPPSAATPHIAALTDASGPARVPFVSGITITSIVPCHICILHIKCPLRD